MHPKTSSRATSKSPSSPQPSFRGSPTPVPPWTFLTNHAHILICIAQDPQARIRDLATRVGITERGVQRIITELEAGGYLAHERDGRRNVYRVNPAQPLRHPVEMHNNVATLLRLAAPSNKRR